MIQLYKFKYGDKVKVINPDHRKSEQTGLIYDNYNHCRNTEGFRVIFGWVKHQGYKDIWFVQPSELELIQPRKEFQDFQLYNTVLINTDKLFWHNRENISLKGQIGTIKEVCQIYSYYVDINGAGFFFADHELLPYRK